MLMTCWLLAWPTDWVLTYPPRRHLHDIVRNARRFADRHGWYPMTGWLEVFAAEGLIRYEPRDRVLEVLP